MKLSRTRAGSGQAHGCNRLPPAELLSSRVVGEVATGLQVLAAGPERNRRTSVNGSVRHLGQLSATCRGARFLNGSSDAAHTAPTSEAVGFATHSRKSRPGSVPVVRGVHPWLDRLGLSALNHINQITLYSISRVTPIQFHRRHGSSAVHEVTARSEPTSRSIRARASETKTGCVGTEGAIRRAGPAGTMAIAVGHLRWIFRRSRSSTVRTSQPEEREGVDQSLSMEHQPD